MSGAQPTNRLLRRAARRTLRADYNLPLASGPLCDHMDDHAPQENPPADFNKIDLTQLQGFSFGTQWTQDKSGGSDRRASDRPSRDDRREGGPDRRDRRGFRKPVSAPAADAPRENRGPGGPAGGDRRPRGGDFRGGPRREFTGEPRGHFPRGESLPRGPYESPFFNSVFYPEDTSFAALAKTIRSSCRTIELFEIARTVIGKPDRFIVVLTRKPASGGQRPGSESPASAGKAEAGKDTAPIYISVPDGLPFETEEAAIAHVLATHRDQFFDASEVEVDPPKGNFQVVNRCGITGALLGPPNYHRYNQIVQHHFATRISRMPLEAFRARIETVREPELIQQWLDSMKKTTRYTWKLTPPAEGETAPTFDSLDEARYHLLTHARDKVVRAADHARFHGKIIETLPPGEIRQAIEGAIERQRRFPLDTANALRGRLRREGFTIFKKGSKGISYVCAVKRKFRTPGQTFSDGIGALISFIEAHPMIRASELPVKFLGLTPPPAPAPTAEGAEPAAPAPTVEQREKLARMQGDLRWLVTEGYVTEFIDGRLFAAPAMVEARKKEIEREDHDPENFPEVPASEAAPTAPAEAAPTGAAATASDAAPATGETPVPAEPASEPAPEATRPANDTTTAAQPEALPPEPTPVSDSAPAETPASPAADSAPRESHDPQ